VWRTTCTAVFLLLCAFGVCVDFAWGVSVVRWGIIATKHFSHLFGMPGQVQSRMNAQGSSRGHHIRRPAIVLFRITTARVANPLHLPSEIGSVDKLHIGVGKRLFKSGANPDPFAGNYVRAIGSRRSSSAMLQCGTLLEYEPRSHGAYQPYCQNDQPFGFSHLEPPSCAYRNGPQPHLTQVGNLPIPQGATRETDAVQSEPACPEYRPDSQYYR